MAELTLSEAARRAGVSPATLRRWGEQGIVPHAGSGKWTPAAVAHARIVARLRARGHTLDQIKAAAKSGRLAFGYVEDLFPSRIDGTTLEDAAAQTGLEPELVERIFTTIGFSAQQLDSLGPEDIQLLDYVAAVLAAGFPLVAFLQLRASTGRRWRRSPTPRCGSSTSTSTSRCCAKASPGSRWPSRWGSSPASSYRSPCR